MGTTAVSLVNGFFAFFVGDGRSSPASCLARFFPIAQIKKTKAKDANSQWVPGLGSIAFSVATASIFLARFPGSRSINRCIHERGKRKRTKWMIVEDKQPQITCPCSTSSNDQIHTLIIHTGMPICISCTALTPYLYTVYETEYNLRLEQCVRLSSSWRNLCT